MPTDDIPLGRQNQFLDLRNNWVDWPQRRLAWRLVARIGDFKSISLDQWFLSQVGASCRSTYRVFFGCLIGRCFGNLACSHRTEHN